MQANWLHVSDFHFRGGDPYDRDVVLRALVKSVRTYRERGRQVDLVFATGDVAHAGQEAEYAAATAFFDALIDAAGIDKRHLFVIPGNHDVDREPGMDLARTLESREAADKYFCPASRNCTSPTSRARSRTGSTAIRRHKIAAARFDLRLGGTDQRPRLSDRHPPHQQRAVLPGR